MANFAILRIEKRKLGSVTSIGKHHERLKEKYKSNEDIDPSRTHLNYHIIEPEGTYREIALAKIEEAGAKRRKDSVVLQDCLVTASPDWIRAKSDQEQADYFNYAYEFLEKRYGRENIVSAVIHLDEATPHMHLTFVPLTPDGKLSSKIIMGGPKGMEKLQDDFHEHMVRKYPDLTRGISKKITHRKHISPQMYKQAAMLTEHYTELVNAINDIGIVGNAKKREEAIATLGRFAPELAQIEGQLKSTEKYIKNLESQIDYDERVIAGKDHKLNDKEVELFALRTKVEQLASQQRKLMKVIEQIPPETLKKMEQEEKLRRKNDRER